MPRGGKSRSKLAARRAGAKGVTGAKAPRGLRALRIAPKIGNLTRNLNRQTLKRGVAAVNRRALVGSSITETELNRLVRNRSR